MKRLVLALILLTTVLCQAQEQGVLRWGADPDSNAPYAFFGSNNKLTGFEYEIINAIARHMGREAKFVQNDWDGLIPGLSRRNLVRRRHLWHRDHAGEGGRGALQQSVLRDVRAARRSQGDATNHLARPAQGQSKSARSTRQPRSPCWKTLPALWRRRTTKRSTPTGTPPIGPHLRRAAGLPDREVLRGAESESPVQRPSVWPDPVRNRHGQGQHQASGGSECRALAAVIASGEMRDILSRWGLWTPTVAGAFGQPEEPSGARHRVQGLRRLACGIRLDRHSSCIGTSATGRCCCGPRSSRWKSRSSA